MSVAMHDEGVDDVPNPRLFIRGLPQDTSKEALLKTFERFGKIVDTNLLMTPDNLCKGVAFITYSTIEEATAAIDECQRPVLIKQQDVLLSVKYSETQQVRRQRNERNKARQHMLSSAGSSVPASPSSMQHTPHSSSVATSVLVPPGIPPPPPPPPPPTTVPPSPSNAPRFMPPGQIAPTTPPPAYPSVPSQLMTHPQAHPLQQQSFLLTNPYASLPMAVPPRQMNQPPVAPFPGSGDFFLSSSTPIGEQTLQALLSPFGPISNVLLTGNGAVVRMHDRNVHVAIVRQFSSGVVLPFSGQVVFAALVA